MLITIAYARVAAEAAELNTCSQMHFAINSAKDLGVGEHSDG